MNGIDIVDLKQKCHQLRTLCHTTNRETDWNDFRNVRNKLKAKIKSTKSSFYRKALSSKKPSEVWKVIHKILNPNSKRIRINPNELYKHFSTTSKRLTGRNNADLHVLKYIINNMSPSSVNKPSFKLRSVSYKETLQKVKRIRNGCSVGNDNMPISLVKLVAENVASPLTYIINECIRLSVFPVEWKCARISVIPKIGNPTTGNDYRPISILPVLSKVFERLIMKQLCNFIETNNIYSSTQAGYRRNHSTNTILIKMRDDILNAMNKGKVTLSILADFSKVFDTVDYTVLIKQLSKLNMSPEFLNLILSYVSNRSQYVKIDSNKFRHEKINFSVPQGSHLLNIYVSDMKNEFDFPCIQYADDTNFYEHCKVSKIPQSITTLRNASKCIYAWSRDNNLVFNRKKTKFMLFSTKQMSN